MDTKRSLQYLYLMLDNMSRDNLLNNYGLPRSYVFFEKNISREKNLSELELRDDISSFPFLLLSFCDLTHANISFKV